MIRRLLMWALRVPSPSKATEAAAVRWAARFPASCFEPLDIRPEEGLLTLREAITGRFADGMRIRDDS